MVRPWKHLQGLHARGLLLKASEMMDEAMQHLQASVLKALETQLADTPASVTTNVIYLLFQAWLWLLVWETAS